MNRLLTTTLVVALFAVALLAGAFRAARGQQEDEAGAEPSQAEAAKEEETGEEERFGREFWEYLVKVEFDEHWQPWPGKPHGRFETDSPHGPWAQLFADRKAVENATEPAAKAIVVQKSFAEDQETLTGIAVMYRVDGFAPEHGDWYWLQYLPDGRIDRADDQPLAGSVQSCIECHKKAEGGDYVFTNDAGDVLPNDAQDEHAAQDENDAPDEKE